MSDTSFENQCHAAITETTVFNHSVLAHFAKDRTMFDLRPGEPGIENRYRAGRGFSPLRNGELSSLPLLISLRPTQGEDDSVPGLHDVLDIQVYQL
jgi:hypothetical protein